MYYANYHTSYILCICSVDATTSQSLGRMVNDGVGRQANCYIKIVQLNNLPRLCLFATRKIYKDDELRFDYGIPNLPWRKTAQSARRFEEKIRAIEKPTGAVTSKLNL